MKKNNILIIGVGIITAIVILIFNPNGLITYIYSKKELQEVSTKLENVQKKLSDLQSHLDSLLYSDQFIEKIIRYKYHMTKSDEDIFKIIQEQ